VEINVALGLLTMELVNLTMDDSGTYTCMATSERASRSDHIILNISEKAEGTGVLYPDKECMYPDKECICAHTL